ncbi:MAG: peptide-methionine (S)-S-oxide reductase MsrA [Synechococcus sp. SB0668_bin_15]|nr:peptide-methionine (S)-S-oxide reductase MsrA [Synechococcus sp. SB0668_bin_15]MXZ82226.1 peptide-methionine (S)-S-oxide reductase MsrA [Synechococcus sp. SB0666_bin_14]MYA90280.1 peptide-methionine (S)-S-oxide reductase MsrA [Synechococcus sp. SB0663_bin_10]MYC49565.1 peptide-methionine (S)-S-oxide reductase MsrA [Synechococcus sp. SB0662_bin_14]MYG46074.1 peptide-methionine (S)-S-oxide reductase MsrA [Synechococcus sp. SB0675_bin_6]MYJ59828.1 peptide-methionine (S)-S-oxide reductase MsrA 
MTLHRSFTWFLGASLFLLLLPGGAALAQEGATPSEQPTPASTETIVLAGGCFWCLESDLEKLPGVVEAVSGYSGGHVPSPSYRQVSSGNTGHREVVEVTFDSQVLPLEDLLQAFWRNIDPLDNGGQFCDRGEQYTSAIFVGTAQQRDVAETSLDEVQARLTDQPVATPVLPAATFYPAEDYHQNYAKNHPVRYRYYRWSCGRDRRLKQLWGDATSGSGEEA